jgi:2'-5' RNA ligase
MRCFISIDLPDEVKSKVFHEFDKIPKSLYKGKVIEKENLHLTLKFLGDLTNKQIEEVKKILGAIKHKKIRSKIGAIGFFDNEDYIKIVWVDLIGENLALLQKLIEEKLSKFRVDDKEFNSHLTVIRVKSVGNKRRFLEEVRKINLKDLTFEIKEFFLMKSELKREGANYKIIEKYLLV